jgi:hypothetical protein
LDPGSGKVEWLNVFETREFHGIAWGEGDERAEIYYEIILFHDLLLVGFCQLKSRLKLRSSKG